MTTEDGRSSFPPSMVSKSLLLCLDQCLLNEFREIRRSTGLFQLGQEESLLLGSEHLAELRYGGEFHVHSRLYQSDGGVQQLRSQLCNQHLIRLIRENASVDVLRQAGELFG